MQLRFNSILNFKFFQFLQYREFKTSPLYSWIVSEFPTSNRQIVDLNSHLASAQYVFVIYTFLQYLYYSCLNNILQHVSVVNKFLFSCVVFLNLHFTNIANQYLLRFYWFVKTKTKISRLVAFKAIVKRHPDIWFRGFKRTAL